MTSDTPDRLLAALDRYHDAFAADQTEATWAATFRAATLEVVVAVGAYLLACGWDDEEPTPAGGALVRTDPRGMVMLHGAFLSANHHASVAELIGLAAWDQLQALDA